MAGFTFSDKQLTALRGVVRASQVISPSTAVSWELLEGVRGLVGCDAVDLHGVDYGDGSSYFAQEPRDEIRTFRGAFDKEAESGFWSLVRATPHTAPWIPEVNESGVSKPTDLMSVRQLRALPVYIDGWEGGRTATTYLMSLNLEDGYQRQVRLLCWREAARHDFTERQRFVLQLLMPHIESAYRRGVRQRTVPQLTARQEELLRWVREGCTNTQIAHRMGLSEGTVRTHLNNIYSRLGVRSRTEAVSRRYLSGPYDGWPSG